MQKIDLCIRIPRFIDQDKIDVKHLDALYGTIYQQCEMNKAEKFGLEKFPAPTI